MYKIEITGTGLTMAEIDALLKAITVVAIDNNIEKGLLNVHVDGAI